MQRFIVLRRIFRSLVEPRSVSDDARRREFVLNVLLLGVLALTVAAFVQVSVNSLVLGSGFNGAPPPMVALIVLIIFGLYSLSRLGHSKWAAYLFIAAFTVIGIMVSYIWGILLPVGSLMFVLVLVMSGILIDTRFSFVVAGVVAGASLVLAYLEMNHITHPNLAWRMDDAGLSDALTYIFVWTIIMLLSWLSNRELQQSLKNTRASEAALEKERNLLEERVEARTRELKQAQLEKMLQLNRFADFGRISSGFFHDIINPLTAVSLNLEQLSTKRRSELLQQAITNIKHIENFAVAARKQVQGNKDLGIFSPAHEAKEVIRILDNKARGAQVTITCDFSDRVKLYGSLIKFHQLVSNLVANAIDAYEETDLRDRVVVVQGVRSGKNLKLTVSDHGVGIKPEHLGLIFDPFFTTKPVDKGTGIGLLIVKRSVEEDFQGSIKVVSKPKTGTIFTILIPAVPE